MGLVRLPWKESKVMWYRLLKVLVYPFYLGLWWVVLLPTAIFLNITGTGVLRGLGFAVHGNRWWYFPWVETWACQECNEPFYYEDIWWKQDHHFDTKHNEFRKKMLPPKSGNLQLHLDLLNHKRTYWNDPQRKPGHS